MQTLGEHPTTGLAADPNADLRELLEQAISAIVRERGLDPGSSPAVTVSIVRQ